MKNKCRINGCGERGVWTWQVGSAYCTRHKPVLVERHARSHRYPFAPTSAYAGFVHDGAKVGKPRAWRFERARKEQGARADA